MDVPAGPRLLDRVRNRIRLKHYSRSTESTYVHWIRRYILFHGKQHPELLGEPEVESFLTHLARNESISASAQNQALAALLFLYKQVLDQPLEEEINAARAKRHAYIPTVLSREEVWSLLHHMEGTLGLMAELTYGSGMRLQEVHGLRVQHLDFAARRIHVYNGKGRRDRITLLPASLIPRLDSHLLRIKALHGEDLRKGYGKSVYPAAYARRTTRALGHRDLATTMVYAHIVDSHRLTTTSPLDLPAGGAP
jgi:site-specific recombinase XerD